MAYTLKQIYAALGAVENGTEMIADLQQELSNVRNEAAQKRIEKNKILEALGIAADGGDAENQLKGIATSMEALKATGAKPDEIGAQLKALADQVKSLTDESAEAKKKAAEEHDKRIGQSKLNKALAALQAHNAADPETISQLILGNLVAKDDDSIVYNTGESEVAVEDGVKEFLTAHPYLVKNTQQAGSGSAGGTGTKKTYSKAEIEAMSPDDINANWADIQASISK